MAEILANHGFGVALPPFFKEQGVVAVTLGAVPHVEGFVHDVHAQLVAGPQQCGGGRVVGHADGIEARLLQQTNAAVLRVIIGGRAKHAVVVVDAGAAKLDGRSVDAKPVSGIQTQSADSGDGGVGIQQIAFFIQRGFHRIQVRGLGRPGGGIKNGETAGNGTLLRFKEGDRCDFLCRFHAVAVDYTCDQRQSAVMAAAIF